MGQKTPNMSIFVPSSGEELYGATFATGMGNVDAHDHSGAPNNGVQIGTNGIQDGAITPAKLSQQVLVIDTVTTTDATATTISSVPVDEIEAVTIIGSVVGIKTDGTAAIGGNYVATFYRPSGGNVTVVGSTIVNLNENFAGAPTFNLVANTGTQAVDLKCTGVAATTIDWKVGYQVIAVS